MLCFDLQMTLMIPTYSRELGRHGYSNLGRCVNYRPVKLSPTYICTVHKHQALPGTGCIIVRHCGSCNPYMISCSCCPAVGWVSVIIRINQWWPNSGLNEQILVWTSSTNRLSSPNHHHLGPFPSSFSRILKKSRERQNFYSITCCKFHVMAAAFRPCTSLITVFSVLRLWEFPYIYSSKVTLISVQTMIIRSIIRPPHHLAFFPGCHQSLRGQGIKGRKNITAPTTAVAFKLKCLGARSWSWPRWWPADPGLWPVRSQCILDWLWVKGTSPKAWAHISLNLGCHRPKDMSCSHLALDHINILNWRSIMIHSAILQVVQYVFLLLSGTVMSRLF